MDRTNLQTNSIFCVLNPKIIDCIRKLSTDSKSKMQEIVLRANRPLSVVLGNECLYFTKNGCVVNRLTDQELIITSKKELFEVFQNICNFSIYSRQYEINNGYITLKGGHRAGICGTAVTKDGNIINIKDISTINIRVAREIKGCSDKLLKYISNGKGMLVCGAPSSGKTTMLRDIARVVSFSQKVSLIDERNELSATVNGIAQNDIGLCDVYDGYKKSVAINQAIRTMSPNMIICDELGTNEDINAVNNGLNCGVTFIASVHCNTKSEIRYKENVRKLLSTNAFSKIVFLDTRERVGKIKEVIDVKEVSYD